MTPFTIIRPDTIEVPLLISVPHCGTHMTEDMASRVADPSLLSSPDTDWYVHELYDFAHDMGIPMIHANYSRYVVDLNRQLPGEASLYQNTARVTELVPLRSFAGQTIYQEGKAPTDAEVAERVNTIHAPYYRAIQTLLAEMQQTFPRVMLYDAHSIKGHVTTIQDAPFVDYMPANRSGVTCPNEFIDTAQRIITERGHSCLSNGPFQGGNITRHFATPDASSPILTFQMEISQRIYMDEASLEKPAERWQETQATLKQIIASFLALL